MNIDELNISITDSSYQEGLEEIINELEKVKIDTFAINDKSQARLYGENIMLEKIIKYLKRCL